MGGYETAENQAREHLAAVERQIADLEATDLDAGGSRLLSNLKRERGRWRSTVRSYDKPVIITGGPESNEGSR